MKSGSTHPNRDAQPLVRERKFVSHGISADAVVSILRAWCAPDGQFPVGELESIYFDDPLLSSYWEKANGDALKRKVRIRWYREAGMPQGSANAYLEIKDRVGAARDKARFRFTASIRDLETRPLEDPWFPALLREQSANAGFPVPDALVPTVSIRYLRHRFVCPETLSRISVDYCISSTRANGRLFPGAATSLPLSLDVVICEAKSAAVRALPFGEALSRLGMRMESFSKYGCLVERIMQGGFT